MNSLLINQSSNMITFKTTNLISKPNEIKRRSNYRKQNIFNKNLSLNPIENEKISSFKINELSSIILPPPAPPLPNNFHEIKQKNLISINENQISKSNSFILINNQDFQIQIQQAKNRLKKFDSIQSKNFSLSTKFNEISSQSKI